MQCDWPVLKFHHTGLQCPLLPSSICMQCACPIMVSHSSMVLSHIILLLYIYSSKQHNRTTHFCFYISHVVCGIWGGGGGGNDAGMPLLSDQLLCAKCQFGNVLKNCLSVMHMLNSSSPLLGIAINIIASCLKG